MSNKDYIKYQHVEKLGTSEVQDILLGKVYVFPKIDGTNAHTWYSSADQQMHYGSRKRELTLEKDNAGFMQWACQQENLTKFCEHHPDHHVWSEWLVPHSLRTYQDDAWRRSFIFDITITDGIRVKHIPYYIYSEMLDNYGIEDYIVPQRILVNPSVERCMEETEANEWLVTEGKGEGVVLKNYDFVNKYGRQTWAKIVTSDFKNKHHKEMGAPVTLCTKLVEQEIVEKYLTEDTVAKVYANLCVLEGGWSSKLIPRLLETTWRDFVVENVYEAVKKNKLPTISFKTLKSLVMRKTKEFLPEVF